MTEIGRVIGGRYRVVSKIAEGGMGAVFVAQHTLSKKDIALKILFEHIGKDEAARARFLREVSAPAQIAHDGIVEVYDAGFDTEDGSLFVAMELLKGEPLRDRLLKGGHSVDQILDWFEEVLDPLEAAHEAGIVHRDLKPENIYVSTKRDGTEMLKILDFGIARDLDGSDTNVTHTGIAMGTPHYMAPEQAMSAKGVTASADIWAMGAMLYEALAGKPPFDGETASAIVVNACTRQHSPLNQISPHVSPALAQFVDRCLSKEALGRPQNGGEMLKELKNLRAGGAPMAATGSATGGAPMAAAGSATGAMPPNVAGTGPYAGGAPYGQTPPPHTPAPMQMTPHGTAMLPAATPPPGGYASAPGAFGQHPSAPGSFVGSQPGSYTSQPGSFVGSQPGSFVGSQPGSQPGSFVGSQPGQFGPPGAYGGAPKSGGGGGMAMGVIAALLIGGLVIVGGGVLIAVVMLSGGDDAEVDRPATTAQITVMTNVIGGELYVDGMSQGPITSSQQFSIERGVHQLEIRERGSSVANATINVVAGSPQTATLNRIAPQMNPLGSPILGRPLPPISQTLPGSLRPGDQTSNVRRGSLADAFHFNWTAGSRVVLELNSSDFDTYLVVRSPSGRQTLDDDGGQGLNSMLDQTLTESGQFEVEVTSYSTGNTGDYVLTVRGP